MYPVREPQIYLESSQICDSIRRRAKSARLTLTELMVEAGVSIETWRSWSKGTRNPSRTMLKLIDGVLKKHETAKRKRPCR